MWICFSCPGPGTGRPGVLPDHSNAENRIWLGGGGGATRTWQQRICGQVVMVEASFFAGQLARMVMDSPSAPIGGSPASANGDGGGGGGAGGSLLLDVSTLSSDVLVELKRKRKQYYRKRLYRSGRWWWRWIGAPYWCSLPAGF